MLLLALTGCQQGFYHGSSLPLQFQAPQRQSSRQLDFARLARAAIRNDVINAGDILSVSVVTGLETELSTWEIRVAEDGTATVPLVGPVRVSGITTAQADQAIRDASVQRQIFVSPQVAVRIANRKSNQVTVMGAVVEPGVKQIPAAGSDVLAALAAAGGLTEEADTIVEIRHPAGGGQKFEPPFLTASHRQQGFQRQQGQISAAGYTRTVNLASAASGSNENLDLTDGSVIVVHKKPQDAVYVMGLVKIAGQYEMPEDRELRVLDAVAMAGGRTLQIANRVRVVRSNPNYNEPIVIRVSVKEAKRNQAANIRLAPGDVVSVEETPTTFGLETIRSFIRFGFSAGIPGF